MVLACTTGDICRVLSLSSLPWQHGGQSIYGHQHTVDFESVTLDSTETQQRKTYLDLINIERYFQS